MKKNILAVIVFFAFAVNSHAILYTWVDSIDFSPDKQVSFFQTANYFHIINCNGFTLGEDTIYSYNHRLKLYDNSGNKISENIAFINQARTSTDKTAPFLFELSNQILGWSLEDVAQLNKIGQLDIAVSTKRGDIFLDCSEVTAYGNVAAPVPEPGTVVLLGFGLLSLAVYRKRRMNKES